MTTNREIESLRLENQTLRDNRRVYEEDRARLENSLERFDGLVEELQQHVDVQAKQLAGFRAGEKHTKQMSQLTREFQVLAQKNRELEAENQSLAAQVQKRNKLVAQRDAELRAMRGAIATFVGQVGGKS